MAYVGKVLKHLRGARPRPKLSGSAGEVPGGEVLASPSFTAGWATFGVPLAPGDCPSGQVLQVGNLTTQTDILSTHGDGSIKMAAVTANIAGTSTLDIRAASPPSPSPFTPTIPSNTKVEFQLHTKCVLLGIFSFTSGTANVTLTQITSGKRIIADIVVLKNTADSTEYILDDADGAVFSTTGSGWNTLGGGSNSAGWPRGKTVHWTTTNGATATWTKTSLPSGTYSVSASWTDWTTITQQGLGDPRATMTIKDNTTTIGTIEVNQLVASAEFVGRVLAQNVNISSGTCVAVLNNSSSDGLTVADAVALYKGGVLISVIDDSDAGCSFAGTWLESGVGWPAGYAYGYKNTYRIANWSSYVGDGSSTATYTWTGLASGSDYTLVAWSLFSPYSTSVLDITMMLTTTAGWTIKDNTTTRATPTVNQRDWGNYDVIETYRAQLSTNFGAQTDFWLDGNLCREHRQVVTPFYVTSGGVEQTSETHPHLRVIYDCRSYSDGSTRIQPIVENGLDMTVATYIHYDVEIFVNNSSVFSVSNVEQWYGARWTKQYSTGGLTESVVTADWSRAYAGKHLYKPRSTVATGEVYTLYDPEVGGVSGPDWNSSTAYFTNILRRGGIDGDGLSGGGFHPQLGSQPSWANQFLIRGNGGGRKDFVIKTGWQAGSYPHHTRDSSTGEPINCINRPNATYNYSQSGSSFLQADGLKGQWDLAATRFGRWQMAANTPHNPNVNYVPFLYSAERYHQEEVLFWANYCLLATIPALREGANCYPNDAAGARGIGWQLRGYAEAYNVSTDGSDMQDYFGTVIDNGMTWCDSYAAGGENFGVNNLPYASVLGCAFNFRITALPGMFGEAAFQQSYVAIGIERCMSLRNTSAGGDLLDLIVTYLVTQQSQHNSGSPNDPSVSTWPYLSNLNSLMNAGFYDWCSDQSDTPMNWTVTTGTAGTQVKKGTSSNRFALPQPVELVSDGSTLVKIQQAFSTTPSALAGAGGTSNTLATSTQYYGLFHLKASSVPTTGTVIIDLINGSGTVLTGCTTTVNCNTLTTSYQRFTFSFTTPSSISGTPSIRVRFGASPDNAITIYLSDLSMWSAPNGYNSHPFYATDGYTVDGATFQHFTTWDQAFTAAMACGRAENTATTFLTFSSNPCPGTPGTVDYTYLYQLMFNIAEVRGIANATARYDQQKADSANNKAYDGFNITRGLF